MKAEIVRQLEKIEAENDVTVIYACESGSRVWGFDNDFSDYDVRFIFKRNKISDYLTLSDKKEVIEVKYDNLDIVGWDVKKALYLHYRSNPNLREWMISPVVYIDWKYDLFYNLPEFNKVILKYHYTNIVVSNWKVLSRDDLEITKRAIKMYLYNCRCILSWLVVDSGGNPEVNIHELLNQADVDENIKKDIFVLTENYKNNSIDLDTVKRIHSWMREYVTVLRSNYPENNDSRSKQDYDMRFFECVLPDFDRYLEWKNGR